MHSLGSGVSTRLAARETTRETTAAATRASIGIRGFRTDVVGVIAELVVNLPLLGVAQDIVSFGDGLEFPLCRLVSGIDVGMVFARKFAKGLPDFFRGGRLLDAKEFVIIFFGRGRHVYWQSILNLVAFCFQNPESFECRCIHVNRNTAHASGRGRQQIPASLVLNKTQKIDLSVNFEMQFQSPLFLKP